MSRFVRVCYTELSLLGKDLKIYFEPVRFGKTGIYNKVTEITFKDPSEQCKISSGDAEIFETIINSEEDIIAYRKQQEEHEQKT